MCVKNNLEWPAEGFGSFVQDRLRPLSGVTWLGCDAAVPGDASTRCRLDALSSQNRPDDGGCGDSAVYFKHGRQATSFTQFRDFLCHVQRRIRAVLNSLDLRQIAPRR